MKNRRVKVTVYSFTGEYVLDYFLDRITDFLEFMVFAVKETAKSLNPHKTANGHFCTSVFVQIKQVRYTVFTNELLYTACHNLTEPG